MRRQVVSQMSNLRFNSVIVRGADLVWASIEVKNKDVTNFQLTQVEIVGYKEINVIKR